MNDAIRALLTDFTLVEGASPEALAALRNLPDVALPAEYLDFLRESNGGEGFVGESYLVLWRAEELEPFNREYQVAERAPGIFLFGSDGGGEGFGFDVRVRPPRVVMLPFIGMEPRYAMPVAECFTGLIEAMSGADGSLLGG